MDVAELPIVRRLRELETALNSSTVVVGWIDGNGSAQVAYAHLQQKKSTGRNQPAVGMPVSLSLIARTLNYGREEGTTEGGVHYPKIPARPFMTFAAEIWDREFPKILKAYFPHVMKGAMSVDMMLKYIGERAREAVQKAIREGEYEPLAASTVERKGSSVPLIDTGRLVNSVTFEIRRS